MTGFALKTAVCLVFTTAATGVLPQGRAPLAATVVVRFTPQLSDLDRAAVASGTCAAQSRAAWFRTDAMQCAAGKTTYDPCFTTSREDTVLCVTDPRSTSGRIPLRLASSSAAPTPTAGSGHRAWFFELTDGSTCRPLATPGREVEGLVERYECKWGTDGPADSVLGDLDSTAATWTISKCQLNKKMDPPTIKWNNSVAVKTVWQ